MTIQHLLAHAAQLGVTVHVAHLPAPYRGYYDSAQKMVVYDFTLGPVERLCVLAHELGHAFYDHRCRGDQAAEDAADLYAAQLLIDPAELARLESISADPEWLAEELRVEVHLLEVFAAHALTRLTGVTYARPRFGRRQYGHVAVYPA